MPALLDIAREQLALAARESLLRSVKETERLAGARVVRGNKGYVSFSCNDYLGLARDPRVIRAAREAL
jgi:8-amino-7-oxononanoate synthase